MGRAKKRETDVAVGVMETEESDEKTAEKEAPDVVNPVGTAGGVSGGADNGTNTVDDTAVAQKDGGEDEKEQTEGSAGGLPVPVEDGEEEAVAYTPGKKKRKKRWFVLAAIVAVAAVFLFLRSRNQSNPGTVVDVIEATKGTIEETVVISGNITSAEKKTYFATVGAPVTTLNIKAGDRVSKGDVLFAYSEEDLERLKKQAKLNLQQANGTYSASLEKNAKATDVLKGNSIHDINNRLTQITDEIDAINKQITAKKDRISATITELQNAMLDIDQDGVADSQQIQYAALSDEDVGTGYVTRRTNNDEDASEGNMQMYLSISKALNEKQYALSHDPEIEKWQNEITALNNEKATLSEQKGAETSKLTGGDKSSLSAQRELTEISSGVTISDVEAAEGGVKADFSGVVTSLAVEEGQTVTKGTKIVSVESTDDVEVNMQVSKVDLPKIKEGQMAEITVNGKKYEGEVSQVSGAATKNSSGVPVVDAKIKIKNPDDALILGVESSNRIHTQKAENVVVVPYAYVGADADGDYVFIAKDGVARRQNVTVGLATSTEAEIVEGVSEGDLIIASDPESLTDGQQILVQAE